MIEEIVTKSIDIKGSLNTNISTKSANPEEHNIPSKVFSRNRYGLINSAEMNYIYNEDGTINWRAMIKPQYLVPNRQKTQETDISKLEDKDLLILLGGIKELAQIRGYTNIAYKVVAANENYFATSCKITWIPNYETEGREISFESLADASINNTKSFARYFLAAIAENRAFVRCVRNFLKINIVGQEELGDAKLIEENIIVDNPTSPYNLLDKLMKEKSITFGTLKAKLIKENIENISSIQDIPKSKIFELIERIKKYDSSK
ncbi:hypothetical protein EBU95_07595 [bacterium]|nr:hypothetical protein [bacterium]